MAREVAVVDQPRAFALIDRAMTLIVDDPDGLRGWSTYGTCGYALYVALSGQRIGHPDVAGLTTRALALRTEAVPFVGAEERKKTQVRLAAGFALLDPAIGRQLLGGIEPPDDYTKMDTHDSRAWLLATALCDPARGIELVDKKIAMLNTKMNWHFGLAELSLTLLAQDRLVQLTNWCHLLDDIYDTD